MSAQPAPQLSAAHATAVDNRPKLLFFHTVSDGRSRRVEGYLAQVLQHRRNHDTFQLYRINCTTRADLAQRFRINNPPTLILVENRRVRARIENHEAAKKSRKH